jgi:hypothetical protein
MGDYDYKNRTMKERLDSLIELYDTELAYLDGLIKLDKLTVRKNNTELDLSTSRACLVRFIEDLNSLARNGPLFRVGQRLAFVHPVGKHNVMSVLDDLELLQETKIKIPKKINMEKRKLSDLSLVELVALRQTLKDDIARHRALQEHGDRRVILDYEEAESKVYRRICDIQQSIDYNN